MSKEFMLSLFDSHLLYRQDTMDLVHNQVVSIKHLIENKVFDVQDILQKMNILAESLVAQSRSRNGYLENIFASEAHSVFLREIGSVEKFREYIELFDIFYGSVSNYFELSEGNPTRAAIQSGFYFLQQQVANSKPDESFEIGAVQKDHFIKINVLIEQELESETLSVENIKYYIHYWLALVTQDIYAKCKEELSGWGEKIIMSTLEYFGSLGSAEMLEKFKGQRYLRDMNIIGFFDIASKFMTNVNNNYAFPVDAFPDDICRNKEVLEEFMKRLSGFLDTYFASIQETVFEASQRVDFASQMIDHRIKEIDQIIGESLDLKTPSDYNNFNESLSKLLATNILKDTEEINILKRCFPQIQLQDQRLEKDEVILFDDFDTEVEKIDSSVATIRILVFESIGVCTKIKNVLIEQYEVDYALTNDEAMVLIEKHRFAVLITDHKFLNQKGMALLEYFKKHRPDTIRIDITADMNAYTLFELSNSGLAFKVIRKDKVDRALPKIVSMAVESYKEARKGKLVNKVLEERNRLLEKLVNDATVQLNQASESRRKMELIERERLEKELETARVIQNALFPEDNVKVKQYLLSAYYTQATECGGDWWTYWLNEEGNKFVVCIADVTGHGAAAAIVTAIAKGASVAIEKMMQQHPEVEWTPDGILDFFNTAIYTSSKGSLYMTAFVCIFDLDEGICHFSNGNHNYPVIYRNDDINAFLDGSEKRLKKGFVTTKGSLVGFAEVATYESSSIKIQPGDTLLMYTDGLIENTNPQDQQLNKRRMFKYVEESVMHSPQKIVKHIVDESFAYYQKQPLDDDITLIVLKYYGNKYQEELGKTVDEEQILKVS